MPSNDPNQQFVSAFEPDAIIQHNEERPWIHCGDNEIRGVSPTARTEEELAVLKIAQVHGVVANNTPMKTKLAWHGKPSGWAPMEGGRELLRFCGTHGWVVDVTLSDGRRAIAKFPDGFHSGPDMHVELRRGLEFERLGLTVIFGTAYSNLGLFGFVMAPMGESLRHWEFPESEPKPDWITDQTFEDVRLVFSRMEESSIPHPDLQYGITKNGRLLLFDYDNQRVDESAEALQEFRLQLPSILAHEISRLEQLKGNGSSH